MYKLKNVGLALALYVGVITVIYNDTLTKDYEVRKNIQAVGSMGGHRLPAIAIETAKVIAQKRVNA